MSGAGFMHMSSFSSAPRRRWISGTLVVALVSCHQGIEPVSKPEPPSAPSSKVTRLPVERREITPLPPPPLPEPSPLPTGPLAVRVGLASDLSFVELPCCDRRLTLSAAGETLPLAEPTRVAPAGTLLERAVFRLQVAALKDEQQARGLAERLMESSGHEADAVFDAGTDLYRVRVGRFTTREQAEVSRGQLEVLGVKDSWIASEGGALEDPALEVVRGEQKLNIPGRWLEIAAPTGVGIPYGNDLYRGRLLIFLNGRGSLNVVNELELEDYLRGVVPKEMGPELYRQIEALKAQTVAARTYAVRNLDEFAEEGFDICSTPRCQVYGGMAVEHPLSDQAIAETAGQVVLFDGEPAETLYGATCGGHTENVELVFPLKSGPYLRGVPCLETGSRRIEGDAPPGTPFPAGLTRRLLPVGSGRPHRILAARMEHLALLAGLPVPRDRLRSVERREVLRFSTSVYDLALDRRLRSSREELERLLEDPPRDWRLRDRDFAAFLTSSSLVSSPGEQPISQGETEELLLHLAVYLGVIERRTCRFLKLAQRRLEVRSQSNRPPEGFGNDTFELPEQLATFSRRGEILRAGNLELMAGDRLDLYLHRGLPAALVQPDEAKSVHLGGRVPKQSWSRFISTRQLKAAVQARYPGFPFEDFEVLERGVSGRVARLRLLGSGGRALEIEGLAVRWTLGVWDNLFWAAPSRGENNEPGWQFRGRGWGHGVGMCQAGAFGMAMRGADYREILEHYYTGIEIGRLKPSPERPRFGEP